MGSATLRRSEADAPAAEVNEMLGCEITGLAIVQTDQIGAAAFRSGEWAAVEENDGNSSVAEGR